MLFRVDLKLLMFFLIIMILIFVKKVPPETILIIDKNSHYHKTMRHGYYLLTPSCKVTTKISTNTLTRVLSDTYETYDGQPAGITVNCAYKADNLDSVLESLSNIRRSIDDIIKSSVYFAANNYSGKDITRESAEFNNKIRDNLTSELATIGVKLVGLSISTLIYQYSLQPFFKPHVSGHDVCNTTDFSDCSNKEVGINNEDPNSEPIIFY